MRLCPGSAQILFFSHAWWATYEEGTVNEVFVDWVEAYLCERVYVCGCL